MRKVSSAFVHLSHLILAASHSLGMAALVPRRARKAVLVPVNANATKKPKHRSALDGARRRKVLSAARGAARGRLPRRSGRARRVARGEGSLSFGGSWVGAPCPRSAGGGRDVTVVAVTLLAPAVCLVALLVLAKERIEKKKKIEQHAFCKGSMRSRLGLKISRT